MIQRQHWPRDAGGELFSFVGITDQHDAVIGIQFGQLDMSGMAPFSLVSPLQAAGSP